ncbi:MAG: serpin family protein [Sphaerochaeta sp.]
MRKTLMIVLVLGVVFSLVAQPIEEKLNPSRPFSEIAKEFSDSLFYAGYGQKENCMISPISALMALGMTTNGAQAETESEMLWALTGSSYTTEELNQQSKQYLASLLSEQVLRISNSLWTNQEYQIAPAFLATIQDAYQGTAQTLDFSDPSSADVINAFVSNATRGAITHLLDEVSPQMLMYVINTIAFKDDWKYQFSANDTREGRFFSETGPQEVPFMHSERTFSYYAGEDYQQIMLPYVQERFAFVAILPEQGLPLSTFLAEREGSSLSDLLFQGVKQSEQVRVRLSLPKFESRYADSLVDELQLLGMQRAFRSGSADFSKMIRASRLPIHIDEVLHKSFIRVDEQGTEAAAVTAVMMRLTSIAPRAAVELRFDRPFFYAIVDLEEEIPLFMGVLDTP